MILIFEQDTRVHNGRRFSWCPRLFRSKFMGRLTWRFCWGMWSISYYAAKGLRPFMEHIEQHRGEWRQ